MTQITALIKSSGHLKLSVKQLKLLQIAVAHYALEREQDPAKVAEYGRIHNKILELRRFLQNDDK